MYLIKVQKTSWTIWEHCVHHLAHIAECKIYICFNTITPTAQIFETTVSPDISEDSHTHIYTYANKMLIIVYSGRQGVNKHC